jgi:hypothetical protein
MNLDEAIKIAIQNGWTTFKGHKIDSVRFIYSGDKRLADVVEEHEGGASSTTFSYDEFFLDPLFWQSLGKGLGWETSENNELGSENGFEEWKFRWHCFIDALAEGRTVEAFFREL